MERLIFEIEPVYRFEECITYLLHIDINQRAYVTVTDIEPASLVISLEAIAQNYLSLNEIVSQQPDSNNVIVAPAIKADAYGLGMQYVGPCLVEAGARHFFVATFEEGTLLRDILPSDDILINVLEGFRRDELDIYQDKQLRPLVNTLNQLDSLLDTKTELAFSLMLDTGMNRLGINHAQAPETAERLSVAGVEPAFILSHLACADQGDHFMNKLQLDNFTKALHSFSGIPASLANSGGIFLGDAYHFDMVRPGIGLYGGEASDKQHSLRLDTIHIEAPVLQIRELAKGDYVGYGASWESPGYSRIATIGVGYADGMMRQVSVGAADDVFVSVGDERVPVIGRISMDTLAIDITSLKQEIAEGDRVMIFKIPGDVDKWASNAHSISYELLTGLGSRLKRHYV